MIHGHKNIKPYYKNTESGGMAPNILKLCNG